MKISLLSLLLCAAPLLAARYPGDYDGPTPRQFEIDNFYLRQTNHDQWEGMPAFFGMSPGPVYRFGLVDS